MRNLKPLRAYLPLWAAWLCTAMFLQSVPAREPIKILAVGDSITQGGKSGRKEYTYRWPLARMLADEGACFQFIGTRNNGLDPDFKWPNAWNSANEGYYGAKTAFVRDKLSESLKKLQAPDLALVDLGTNDEDGSIKQDIVQPLADIVTMLRKSSPNVTVFLAKIPSRFPRSIYLHYRIDRLAEESSTEASKVLAVDIADGWSTAEDTFDGVHPNLRGQRKIAERFLAAMRPYLKLDPRIDGCPAP